MGLNSFVLFNGRIYTVSQRYGLVDALAVENGEIIAVGKKKDVLAVSGATEKINLENKTVIPGFIDSHTHFIKYSLGLGRLNLNMTKSKKEVLERVSQEVERRRRGEWIIGSGWDESIWPEKTFIYRKELDKIAPENPVLLERIDGHLCTVNSLALELLNLPKSLTGVEKDSLGELTGILVEEAKNYAIEKIEPSIKEKKEWVVKGIKRAYSLGITSIHDNVNSGDIKTYLELKKENKLKLRIYLLIERKLLDCLEKTGFSTGFGDEPFKIGALKIFLDGSIGAKTAAVEGGYVDEINNEGMLLLSEKELIEVIERTKEIKLQLAIHAIGDKAIETALKTLKKVLNKKCSSFRHRIEHLELVKDQQINVMKRLGVVCSMQPNFIGRWGGKNQLYQLRLGERYKSMNPFRKIYDSGICLAFGSDMMPFNPFYGLNSTVNSPFPIQKLTMEEAIKCYTYGGSYASVSETVKGTLEPGKFADFVILSKDPFIQPETLNKVKVVSTFIGGEQIYSLTSPDQE